MSMVYNHRRRYSHCYRPKKGFSIKSINRCLLRFFRTKLLDRTYGSNVNLQNDENATYTYNNPSVTPGSSGVVFKVGMVFQSFNLFNNMDVLRNCMIGQMTVLKRDKETAKANALKYLNLVGMTQFINARPAQLSGGQKQRVAIARALAMGPECLLFDEPTSALDPEIVGEVLDVMKNLAKTGLTMIIVTHEMQFARDVSDRVIFIDEGTVLEDKSSKDFFDHPDKERVISFLKLMNH